MDTKPDENEARSAIVGDLLLVAGKGHFATYALDRRELVIGRDPACDIVIDDAMFSRRHAVLRNGPPLTVQDLGSTNGVRLPTRTVRGGEPIELCVGDGFHIGKFSFLVVAAHPSHASSTRQSGLERLAVEDPTVDGVPGFVHEVATSGVNVLVLGESGVGKDVLAETLHVLSCRTGELARVNCAALAEPLIESELFGHEKGAFTGAATSKVGLLESAQGGTVFLDEIGELPLGTQAKLLRAIESREVLRIGSIRPVKIDVRFIAATNRDLPAEVAAKRFRHDLYYRLDGITLLIPSLRERRDRIAVLASLFNIAACTRLGRRPASFAPEVFTALEAHDWPGNVRELKAVVERALLLARGNEVGVRHLAFSRHVDETPPRAPLVPAAVVLPGADPFLATLTAEQRAERQQVLDALDRTAGNQTRAAKELGISRTTLLGLLRLYRIARPRS